MTVRRLGIVPNYSPSSGGEYQYSQTLIHALAQDEALLSQWRFAMMLRAQDRAYVPPLPAGWDRIGLRPTRKERLLDEVKFAIGQRPRLKQLAERLIGRRVGRVAQPQQEVRRRDDYTAWFAANRLDLMLYTTPNTLAFEAQTPAVMPIHDLQHRLQPEFPEVSTGGEFEWREYLYGNACRRARMILVDSEVGKEDVLACYGHLGITAERVGVLPFLPAHYLKADVDATQADAVRRRYGLPPRYFFYPAQFWPHKNHRRLVEALASLNDADAHLALPGSHTGPLRQAVFAEVIETAARLGVRDRLHLIGYVPDADMSALYAGAVALVMPTFFGPTNIPVLEAWAFGCPVITSDQRGIREQVGDAGLLADPRSAEAIGAAMRRLWADDTLRADLRERGYQRLASYTPDDFARRLGEILHRAAA